MTTNDKSNNGYEYVLTSKPEAMHLEPCTNGSLSDIEEHKDLLWKVMCTNRCKKAENRSKRERKRENRDAVEALSRKGN